MEDSDVRFEERYRVLASRDTRFDGQFFAGVTSTGIYCRPSCPARTPKRENVRFFTTSAAAQAAGLRACKRCLPEATPGSPQWDIRSDVVARVMRLVSDGVVDREGVAGIARRVGYSERHLHRILTEQIGAGLLALARARRAQAARELIVGTGLPLADIAFASGFASIRSFNETVRAVFDLTPRELRAQGQSARRPFERYTVGHDRSGRGRSEQCPSVRIPASAGAQSPGSRVSLTVTLPVRHPFDAPGVFDFLAARAIPGVESAVRESENRLRYARTLRLPGGPAAIETVLDRPGPTWRVRAHLELASLADVGPAIARTRRMLDLDADPVAIDADLSTDLRLATLVAATPGIRMPGAVDGPELAIRAVVGQQISVAAARTQLTRLVAAAGEPHSSDFTGLSRLFPTLTSVAELPVPAFDQPLDLRRVLRLPRRVMGSVHRLATALASGELEIDAACDPVALDHDLRQLPGIGEWTSAYIRMRVLADPDVWLTGDVAALRGAQCQHMGPDAHLSLEPDSRSGTDAQLGPRPAGYPQARPLHARPLHARQHQVGNREPKRPELGGRELTHRQLAVIAQQWAPWRSYALAHLWRSASTRTVSLVSAGSDGFSGPGSG